MKNKKNVKKITLQIPEHVYNAVCQSYENEKLTLDGLVKNEQQMFQELFQYSLQAFYEKNQSVAAVYFDRG